MAAPISVYLQDSTLRKLDALVERQAKEDRARGLSGRQVASRSKVIDRIISEYCAGQSPLNRESIRYYVVDLAKQYGAAKVSLFGSYARGDQRADSDVDLLLEKGEIKGMEVFDFQKDLSDKLGCDVDVVTTAGASDRFLGRIAQEAIVLYDSEAA